MSHPRLEKRSAAAVASLVSVAGAASRGAVLARVLAAVLAAVACLGACARPPPEPARVEEDALTVLAASSLREVFTALATDFEREHPGVKVSFAFAGSQELRTQLEHGARADIYASADPEPMDALSRAGLVTAPVSFARNRLAVVVSKEAATSIRTFAELPQASRIVLAAQSVPAGRYADELLRRAALPLGADFPARVMKRVVSRELNVKQVLAKLLLGEADAAVVYRSDVTGHPELVLLPLPEGVDVVATYPMATVVGAPHPTLARSWQELVLSARGQLLLRDAGFLPIAEPTP